MCHSIPFACKYPLRNTCKFIVKTCCWNNNFLVYYFTLSNTADCNTYAGDFGVCDVHNLSNSKEIKKEDRVISVPDIQLAIYCTQIIAI